MSFVRKRLLETLPDDEGLRYALDEQFLNTYISTQIRVLRESQQMTQTQLAKAAKTGQSQISEMEGDYDSWSLRTLRKLARAFGLRLFVTFESWSELIPRMEGFRRENLLRPRIEDEPEFSGGAVIADVNVTVARRQIPGVSTASLRMLTSNPITVVGRQPSTLLQPQVRNV
jgi:transcriptional regulator with XRE-family HTH domain